MEDWPCRVMIKTCPRKSDKTPMNRSTNQMPSAPHMVRLRGIRSSRDTDDIATLKPWSKNLHPLPVSFAESRTPGGFPTCPALGDDRRQDAEEAAVLRGFQTSMRASTKSNRSNWSDCKTSNQGGGTLGPAMATRRGSWEVLSPCRTWGHPRAWERPREGGATEG